MNQSINQSTNEDPNSALSNMHESSIMFSVDANLFSCDCGDQKLFKRSTENWNQSWN